MLQDRAGLSALLHEALLVDPDERRVMAHVHGFHSYPARLHPDTASVLIGGLSSSGAPVLDPFCGSGTVAVCSRVLGRRALASDLSPLAVALTHLKVDGASPARVADLEAAAERVVAHATDRKAARRGPTHRYGADDRDLFAPHVLLELDGLRDGIDRLPSGWIAHALRLVHSAMITKVAKVGGDSSESRREKRLPGGFCLGFFRMKTRDLGARLLEYTALLPRRAPPAKVTLSDARRLRHLRERSTALVVTSPPYPGVFDYFQHHRTRLRWLRTESRVLERGEIGARRHAGSGRQAVAQWTADFGSCLGELRRVLRPGGFAALLLADSVFGGRAFLVERWLPELLVREGFSLVAHAAQARPYFHDRTERAFATTPRREHLIVLR